MNNGFFPMGFLNKKIYKALCQNDEPPTLYALMNSYVNFNKEDSEKVAIIDLPNAFKDYLFDFYYPLDNEYKDDFEENFLTHYMMRRIGFETYMSFKIHLKDKLNQIMPKYNKMLEGFNELDFSGDTETHSRTLADNRSGLSSTTSSNATTTSTSSTGQTATTTDNRYSDTPQGQLSNVQNGTYLTDYTYNTQNGSSNATGSGSSTSYNTGSGTSSDSKQVAENITINKLDSINEYEKYLKIANNIYTLIYKECDSLFYGITPY